MYVTRARALPAFSPIAKFKATKISAGVYRNTWAGLYTAEMSTIDAVDGSHHQHLGAEMRCQSTICQCRLLAKSRPPAARNRLPLLPQHQTFRSPHWTSGFDPTRTLRQSRISGTDQTQTVRNSYWCSKFFTDEHNISLPINLSVLTVPSRSADD